MPMAIVYFSQPNVCGGSLFFLLQNKKLFLSNNETDDSTPRWQSHPKCYAFEASSLATTDIQHKISHVTNNNKLNWMWHLRFKRMWTLRIEFWAAAITIPSVSSSFFSCYSVSGLLSLPPLKQNAKFSKWIMVEFKANRRRAKDAKAKKEKRQTS